MKIHIVSGFLGSGKTTFIKKWLPSLNGKICLIENDFGDISIDSHLFPHTLEVKEIYAGCICCSLVGPFTEGIKSLFEMHRPDHLIIEPSGVGALTEVLKVCKKLIDNHSGQMFLGNVYTLVDVTAFEDYLENFGSFYTDQIQSAPLIFLSYLEELEEAPLQEIIETIQGLNQKGHIVSKEWLRMDQIEFDALTSWPIHGKVDFNSDESLLSAASLLSSFSIKGPKQFSLDDFLQEFNKIESLSTGDIIRSKGVIKLITGEHVHFDYTPFHREWRYIEDTVEPGIAFIGRSINKKKLRKAFSKSAIVKSKVGV